MINLLIILALCLSWSAVLVVLEKSVFRKHDTVRAFNALFFLSNVVHLVIIAGVSSLELIVTEFILGIILIRTLFMWLYLEVFVPRMGTYFQEKGCFLFLVLMASLTLNRAFLI